MSYPIRYRILKSFDLAISVLHPIRITEATDQKRKQLCQPRVDIWLAIQNDWMNRCYVLQNPFLGLIMFPKNYPKIWNLLNDPGPSL